MQVYNNAPAFGVWVSYSSNVSNLRSSMAKLSTGLGIMSAADDPAGLAISERLRAQYRNSAAASNNIENMISYTQTADSWMQKIHDILGRMAELAVAANDGTKSQTDKNNLQIEFAQMQTEIQRITSGGTAAGQYNGVKLFQGGSLNLQVGPECGQIFFASSLNLAATNTAHMGTYSSTGEASVSWASVVNTAGAGGVSISVQSNAAKALGQLNSAIDFISQKRAVLGAQQSRLQHTLAGMRSYESNIRAAESRIRDVDVARETTEYAKYQILTQISTAMLAQANALPMGVVQLIG